MTTVFVGIGSNVEPEQHVRAAVQRLRQGFGTLQISPVYRNPAVGFQGDDFLNLAVVFETAAGAAEVHAALDAIELQCGRVRGGPRFAPRALDLDLLLHGALVTESPLRLPRPEILKYAYVLKPLADLAPGHRHPGTGRSFAEHWREFAGKDQPLVAVTLEGL
ncbi:MAG: 2-amino-4-hydroxy-6-hydroxymethyldihydropteridine diphosphokinase [Gammaproteobacteria bacterium]|nr:2-amino-4-hydroxy-6-hydroxymethyldihydropteridine diphosphokinase [Gammaproteobacteria bacterium]